MTYFVDAPASHAVFHPEKQGKVTLFSGTTMFVGLNCFEPGQRHEAHAHAGADKLYYVLEGEGWFDVGEEARRVGVGGMVVAPAGMSHGVNNTGESRLVVLMVLAPPPRRG